MAQQLSSTGKSVSASEAVSRIRDGDTVYVTEAPYVQWQKTLSAITGTAGTANALSGSGG